MLYEIYFEPSISQWRIRIIVIYLFFFTWSRVASTPVGVRDDEEPGGPLNYPTYDAAAKAANEMGLPKAYKLRVRMKDYTSWVQGEACHGTN